MASSLFAVHRGEFSQRSRDKRVVRTTHAGMDGHGPSLFARALP